MTPDRHARHWARRYPPLASGLVALAIAALVLPSALNVPQTNPSQTLEFAPVPPTDDEPPPAAGNVSSLSLGTSAGFAGDALGGDDGGLPPVPGTPEGMGERPVTKRCVGNPPRQTEDPMSPPCVAHFEGDNQGATAAGVSREEVLVLVYVAAQDFGAGITCHQQGCDVNQYYDLGKDESESPFDERDAYWPHVWRTWQRYFNNRYQTYDRFVRIVVHYGSMDTSPESRRADVADAAARLDPFAVVADVDINGEVYAEEWARRGKVVFMTKTTVFEEVGFDERFFQKHPGGIWDYNPSLQELGSNFTSFLCSQVVGHPVSFSGDGTIGQPRRLGLVVSRDPEVPNRIDYGELVQERLEGCGADIASVRAYDAVNTDRDASAALMRQDGVTTIVYLTREHGFTRSVAGQLGWRPEWLVQMDRTFTINLGEVPTVFQHARNFTVWPRVAHGAERPCEQAFLEADPNDTSFSQEWPVCYTFNSARMLFTGIQVAGPRLTLESLDVGMHAIPDIPSGDPKVPACFYRTGDYTCVKDAHPQWWDPTGRMDRASQSGCWRSMDDGKRYLPGTWPVRDVDAARRPTVDGCNLQGFYY